MIEPAISINACMERFIISGRATVSTVRDCSSDAFKRQVRQGVERVVPAKKRPALTRELLEDERLDYSTEEAKFFAIDRLARLGVHISHQFYIDDRDSRTTENTLEQGVTTSGKNK